MLGNVTVAMYDILVLGHHHRRPSGEIFFPETQTDIVDVVQEFYRHARLPGAFGAVDGCLVQTPLLQTASVCTRTVE